PHLSCDGRTRLRCQIRTRGASPPQRGVTPSRIRPLPSPPAQESVARSRDTANFIPSLPVPRCPPGARPRHSALACTPLSGHVVEPRRLLVEHFLRPDREKACTRPGKDRVPTRRQTGGYSHGGAKHPREWGHLSRPGTRL